MFVNFFIILVGIIAALLLARIFQILQSSAPRRPHPSKCNVEYRRASGKDEHSVHNLDGRNTSIQLYARKRRGSFGAETEMKFLPVDRDKDEVRDFLEFSNCKPSRIGKNCFPLNHDEAHNIRDHEQVSHPSWISRALCLWLSTVSGFKTDCFFEATQPHVSKASCRDTKPHISPALSVKT